MFVVLGEIENVDGTPFDLRSGVNLGERIHLKPLADPVGGRPGFDQNFCTRVNRDKKEMCLVARYFLFIIHFHLVYVN